MPNCDCQQIDVAVDRQWNNRQRVCRKDESVVEPAEFIADNSERIALIINVSGGKTAPGCWALSVLSFRIFRRIASWPTRGLSTVTPNCTAFWDGIARCPQPEQGLSGDGSCTRQVSFGTIPAVYERSEARSDPEVHSPIASLGAHQLHGNARPGVGSACGTGAVVAG